MCILEGKSSGGGVNGNAAAVAASLESGGKPKRLTLKQRQEVLKEKQEAMKAARLAKAKSSSKGAAGSAAKSKDDDDLPDYLKHCSKAQKNAYLWVIIFS